MISMPTQRATVSLSALLHGVCELPAGCERQLSGIALDSRKVQPGDLFLACKGGQVDGRDYIAGAIASGAVAVLVEADAAWRALREEAQVPVIPVADLPKKLVRVAARFYGEPASKLRLVGITGTNGKTTCCQLVARALTALGYRCGVIGTLGHGIVGSDLHMDAGGPSTTPDAIRLQQIFHDLLAEQGDTVVMEVSSHGLQQHRVDVDDFSVAVFTNLSHDHLDYHGSMAAYGESKRTLFTGNALQAALLNLDDPYSRTIIDALPDKVRVLTWSLQDEQASLHVRKLDFTDQGLVLDVHTPWGNGTIRSSLLGSFNASNLLAVLGTVLACESGRDDFDPARIMPLLGELSPVAGRMELVGGYPVAAVVDYAHTPAGLESALRALREHFSGDITCVFGCGGNRDKRKRPLMAKVAEQFADAVVVTDDNPRNEDSAAIIREIMDGFSNPQQIRVESDRARAITDAVASAAPGSVVLVAGKGHENYQETRGTRVPFSDVQQAKLALQQRFAPVPLQ